MTELCFGCRIPQAGNVYVHPDTGQGFCMTCARGMPMNSAEWAMILLTTPGTAIGPPFRRGDVVECRRAAQIYEGVGVVVGMDMSLAHGGTPLYPMFHVKLTEKAGDEVPDEAWYAEVSLTPVREKEAVGD